MSNTDNKMFMNDVNKKDEVKTIASQDLKKFGIKTRPKKLKQIQTAKNGNRVFEVPLELLPTETVTLSTGQQVAAPKLVHELCSFILTKAEVEGLFRKEGSKSRQNELKVNLNARRHLGERHHVIDVAAVLKTFLRQLPEPLIPYGYHDLFLRCIILEQEHRLNAILLACLLLPMDHLNALSYLMQFLNAITQLSAYNRMDAYNLAVVIGPTAFPVTTKVASNAQLSIQKTCEMFKLLIENASLIGVLPEDIVERIGTSPAHIIDEIDRKKKRRSGSLTRMFNGFKKIVGGKSGEENTNIVVPDLLLTPINRSVKKRRPQTNGISYKKKKELVGKLPESTLLSTPFTPRTPVNMNLSGSRDTKFNNSTDLFSKCRVVKDNKKSQWFSRSKSVKNLKSGSDIQVKKVTPKGVLERRWSAVSQAANMRKNKKRNSCAATLEQSHQVPSKAKIPEIVPEPDYVRVSKTEYEAFINKVSAIERRISCFELQNVPEADKSSDVLKKDDGDGNNIESVQTAYEQTLNQAKLSPTTDHLARRLSRDLKIRRSGEQKIIRSPSARKIGSMRRRSRESERYTKLARHQTWHVANEDSAGTRASLKRGKPNTVQTGLPAKDSTPSDGESSTQYEVSCASSGNSSNDQWVTAECFFDSCGSTRSDLTGEGRASLAALRNRNAGMVLAKAKLFDGLKDCKPIPRPKLCTNKIGSVRQPDARLSCRVRTLKYDDKLKKTLSSPKRRNHNGFVTQKQRMQTAKLYVNNNLSCNNKKQQISDKENNLSDGTFSINEGQGQISPLKDCNRIDGVVNSKNKSPATPHIKKTLNTKSPKRLCRTPGRLERNTPLKVLVTPIHKNHI